VSTAAPSLDLRGIVKRFGSSVALDHAEFSLRPGTVHALLGENGAGKTTLMRIAYGLIPADHGAVLLDGRPLRLRGPRDAIAAGIGMVHQHFTNVPRMTVAENVALGNKGRYRADRAAERVRAVGDAAGLRLDPAARAEQLPVSAQQRLEIVKALAGHARILIMDEPTAVLAPAEAQELLHWLRSFADGGSSAVLITHKLGEALSVADDVTVLRRGRTVLQQPRSDLSENELAHAMLGVPRALDRSEHEPRVGEIVVRADRISVADERGLPRIVDASFELRTGEIVGVAAIEGSGQRELLRALARRLSIARGTLELPDRVAFVPEDRHRDALVLEFSLTENVALHRAGSRRGLMPWAQLTSRTEEILGAYDVHAAGAHAPASSLSGGNQQRLVLGRELEARPAVLVAENPTRGLDLNATAEVHGRLRDAASNGMAIVLYSNDLDEVLAVATRVLVVQAGRVLEVPVDRERAGKAMLGIS
jgi:general nucleoside transport system ATP-binding protein